MKTFARRTGLAIVITICLVTLVAAQNQPSSDSGSMPAAIQDQSQQTQPGDTAGQNQPAQPSDTAVQPGNAVGTDTSNAPPKEGKKVHVWGVITQRNPDDVIVRTYDGGTVKVKLTDSTKYEEAKQNPFRGRRKYAVTQLMNGLPVKVGARTDGSGGLVAYRLKFTNQDYRVGQSVVSQVIPLQGQIDTNKRQIAALEANDERLAGQIEENRGATRAAQTSADAAQQTANNGLAAAAAVNQRVSALGDYDVKEKSVVRFKVGSALLTPEAKQLLDQLATEAGGEKGYLVQIQGFCSSDGSESLNMALSRKRAEAVADYLAINHKIPLRHMAIPFGYGETNPVASNDTKEGREQNRRAEVSILVNKGLAESPALPSSPSTNAPATGDVPPPPR